MPDKKISELDALPNGLLDPADEWVIQRAEADNFKVQTAELIAALDALYAPLPHVSDTSIHFPDAPSDGNQYARQNGSWTIVTGGGGGGGAVDSVFGRTGNVVAATNDYNSSQILNVSAVSGASVTNALNTLDISKAPIDIDVLDSQAALLTFGGGNYTQFLPGAPDQVLSIVPGPGLAWVDSDTTIQNDTITNAKLADMAANTIKMRGQPTAGDPEDREIESLVDVGIPAAGDRILVQKEGGDLGQAQIGNLPGGGGGGGIDPIFNTHTWTLSGTFTNSTFVVPFYVAKGTEFMKLTRVNAVLQTGAFTNAKIQKNGVDVAGLTTMSLTAGVPQVFNPTTGGGEPLNDGDLLSLVWTDTFGGAADLTMSVVTSNQSAP